MRARAPFQQDAIGFSESSDPGSVIVNARRIHGGVPKETISIDTVEVSSQDCDWSVWILARNSDANARLIEPGRRRHQLDLDVFSPCCISHFFPLLEKPMRSLNSDG